MIDYDYREDEDGDKCVFHPNVMVADGDYGDIDGDDDDVDGDDSGVDANDDDVDGDDDDDDNVGGFERPLLSQPELPRDQLPRQESTKIFGQTVSR